MGQGDGLDVGWLDQKTEARRRIVRDEPTRDLARSYGVSVSTISRLTT